VRVLITGGAGYIGSFTARRLSTAGHDIVVVDDLSEGHSLAIESDWLIKGNLGNTELINNLIKRYNIEAVMHFGASASEIQSNKDPLLYYQNNLINTIELLKVMLNLNVKKIVYSSSAAVYGATEENPIVETAQIKPLSCYAHTKLAVEYVLENFRRAYGLGYASLRYFNVAGATPDGRFGEDHRPETHLIPIAIQVPLDKRKEFLVLGNDFDTPDGTTIRDYVHVEDIAEANLLALEALKPSIPMVYNIGTGNGSSVFEVIRATEEITGKSIPTRISQ